MEKNTSLENFPFPFQISNRVHNITSSKKEKKIIVDTFSQSTFSSWIYRKIKKIEAKKVKLNPKLNLEEVLIHKKIDISNYKKRP